MSALVHVGDVGTKFTPTVKDQDGNVVDISNATLVMKFKKPDATTLTKTPTLVNTGTDGICRYTSVTGDLDIPGMWSAQVTATISASVFHSDLHEFMVAPNL